MFEDMDKKIEEKVNHILEKKVNYILEEKEYKKLKNICSTCKNSTKLKDAYLYSEDKINYSSWNVCKIKDDIGSGGKRIECSEYKEEK